LSIYGNQWKPLDGTNGNLWGSINFQNKGNKYLDWNLDSKKYEVCINNPPLLGLP